ncbi:hypothetical protein Fcan01_11615 [Folsomia candida]|uniref:Uncharacterized protein n=1 Tax=Folsomia candida TaxID=158441 RepID=A0A226E8A9_FOLCA|nr:hypothetical protein Fcan01_11615 [Folsomia candida]
MIFIKIYILILVRLNLRGTRASLLLFDIPNLFRESTITYIFEDGLNYETSVGPNLRYSNPYTPQVLLSITHNMSDLVIVSKMERYATLRNDLEGITITLKSSSNQATFTLFGTNLPTKDNRLITPRMLDLCDIIHLTARFINPNYIFVSKGEIPGYINCFSLYTVIPTRAKLIVYSENSIWIPCVSCEKISLIRIPIVSLKSIDNIWDAALSNMHQNVVQFVDESNSIPPGYRTRSRECGPHLTPDIWTEQPLSLCILWTLMESLNFTLIRRLHFGHKDEYRLMYDIVFNIAATDALISVSFKFQISTKTFPFVVVTSRPSLQNDFATYLSPLDGPTWLFMLLFSTVKAVILLSKNRVDVIGTILKINSLLLGQTGCPDCLAVFKSKMLLSVWLFGCYILTGNLYAGGIYSTLTVMVSPPVPKTMEALVQSKLPVVTMTSFITWTDKNEPVMTSVVAAMIKAIQPPVSDIIKKFESQLIFPDPYRYFLPVFIDSVSNSSSIPLLGGNASLDAGRPFGLLDEEKITTFFGRTVNLKGKKFVVPNREETPFAYSVLVCGWANSFGPQIFSKMEAFESSGLKARWTEVTYFRRRLSTMKQHYENMSSKYFRKELAKAKAQIEFHESQPVSFLAVRYMFAVCAVISLLAGLVYLWEDSKRVWGTARQFRKWTLKLFMRWWSSKKCLRR